MRLKIQNRVNPKLPFAILEKRFRENEATDEQIKHARQQHAAGIHLVFYTMNLY